MSQLRLLHITDPHLFADAAGELRGAVTLATLGRVLDAYRGADWRADRVALTGDLVQDDSRGAYRRIADTIGGLGLPVDCVPGNHDVRPLMREVLGELPFHYCAAVEAGDWLLVGIDTCIDGSAGGAVAAAELERLDAALRESGAAHALVLLHHPPVELGSAWLDSVGLRDGAALLDALRATGKVRGLLFGHAHQAFDADVRGLRILGTPSTCRQFLPGADEFAVDDRPPAFRRVVLYADGGIDTELVWADE